MYRKVENSNHMTANEACAVYPNDFILMRCDNDRDLDIKGTPLYVGDDYGELFRLAGELDEPSLCIVLEGLNYQRSLGGIVVGG